MRRRLVIVVAILCFVASISGAVTIWWRYRYPYGWSHCCDKQLYTALRTYAESHDEHFPEGGETPEASLGLLYIWDPQWANPDLLRGKTVPEEFVRSRLDRGLPLTPETCGWHYVEGLTLEDAGSLGLFWDKAGLGHNGERLSDGGHIVTFVGGHSDYVSAKEWPAFIAQQKDLRAARPEGDETD